MNAKLMNVKVLDLGVPAYHIHRQLFGNRPWERMQLWLTGGTGSLSKNDIITCELRSCVEERKSFTLNLRMGGLQVRVSPGDVYLGIDIGCVQAVYLTQTQMALAEYFVDFGDVLSSLSRTAESAAKKVTTCCIFFPLIFSVRDIDVHRRCLSSSSRLTYI